MSFHTKNLIRSGALNKCTFVRLTLGEPLEDQVAKSCLDMILEGGPCPRAGPCCAWRRPTRSGRRTSAALTARPFLFGLDQCKMPDFHCLVPAKASHLNIHDRRFYGIGSLDYL